MKTLLLAVALLFATPLLADTGTVVKWKSESYSQSAHIIRNQIVYTIKIGDIVYQVTRHNDKVEFTNGQTVECRPDKNRMFITNDKGKEVKFEIVGEESR